MVNDSGKVAQIAASSSRGCIVAAAGCGKTEQIVLATRVSPGRRLILTHTHAGIDAIRLRLKKFQIPNNRYRVETIAGWCFLYASSFPRRSGHCLEKPRTNDEWDSVYKAAATLLTSGAVNRVLVSSYAGVFVDEYQDCTGPQHEVIKSLAEQLPVCVFGDPLQAIFDFKGQCPVDWDADVFPFFTKAATLTTPWRWRNAGNKELAYWLAGVRLSLKQGGSVDLRNSPKCVNWHHLPSNPNEQRAAIFARCQMVATLNKDDRLIVIGDSVNTNARAAIAKNLAKMRFRNIEAISCKHLYDFAQRIEASYGQVRLEAALDFICACMTGAERSEFLKSVRSHRNGGKSGVTKFGSLIEKAQSVINEKTDFR
jgi:hypothetical protein